MNDTKEQIQAYLAEAKMMQLATATNDGKPWVCNVWFAADDAMNIYWISSTNRRHSQEIAKNSQVAASMCLVREPNESDKGALQVEGIAEQVTSPVEIAKALKLYAARGIFTAKQVKSFMADLEYPHKFYKIRPATISIFLGSKQEYKVHA